MRRTKRILLYVFFCGLAALCVEHESRPTDAELAVLFLIATRDDCSPPVPVEKAVSCAIERAFPK